MKKYIPLATLFVVFILCVAGTLFGSSGGVQIFMGAMSALTLFFLIACVDATMRLP